MLLEAEVLGPCHVFLHGTLGGNTLVPMPVLEHFTFTAPGTRSAKPSTSVICTRCSLGLFERGAIRGGESRHPTFATEVELHRLVDAIKKASDNGREVT
jgi:hypothetical protein